MSELQSSALTPEADAIENAASYIGIEPERMAAAIEMYRHRMYLVPRQPVEDILKKAELMDEYLKDIIHGRYMGITVENDVKSLFQSAQMYAFYIKQAAERAIQESEAA